jgi:hypothetical protein
MFSINIKGVTDQNPNKVLYKDDSMVVLEKRVSGHYDYVIYNHKHMPAKLIQTGERGMELHMRYGQRFSTKQKAEQAFQETKNNLTHTVALTAAEINSL